MREVFLQINIFFLEQYGFCLHWKMTSLNKLVRCLTGSVVKQMTIYLFIFSDIK